MREKRCAGLVLFAALSATALGQGTPEGPNQDDLGDPVPPGVRARFGTLRLRHDRDVASLAFSPDGKTFASTGSDGEIRLWDVATGKELRRSRRRRGAFLSVAFPPDGKWLAAGTNDGVAQVSLETLQESWSETGHVFWTNDVACSPDGKTILSWGKGHDGPGVVRLFDASSGKMLWEQNEATPGFAAFSPDSKTIAVGIDKERVSLRDAATGKETSKIACTGGDAVFSALAYSKDGKTIAAWGRGRAHVRFLDVPGKKERKKVACKPGDGMECAAFSPDLASVAFGKDRLVLADLEKGAAPRTLAETSGPDSLVQALAFSPDSKVVLAGRASPVTKGSARIHAFVVATGAEAIPLGSREPAVGLAFSHDGKLLAVLRQDEIDVRDLGMKTTRRKLAGKHLSQVAFSPDGKTIAASSRERVLSWGEGDEKPRESPAHPGFHVVAFSLAKNLVAVEDDKLELALIDLASGKELCRAGASPAKGAIFQFSPDGSLLVCAASAKPIRATETATGKTAREVQNESEVLCLAVSPDGKTLGYAVKKDANSHPVQIADLETWSAKKALAVPSTIGVAALAFSPDSKTLAQGSSRTAFLFEVP
ncbi:WD40 repeat domain-containing protein [bacterium]|nr:WD40 repeat domain-containing protein [bacterium]